jgi:spore coat protein CotF
MNSTDYFGDREILNDLLISEKHISNSYNTYIGEATSQPFRQILENILNDTHEMHSEIWNSMVKRGWYKVKNANSQDVEMVKKKFQHIAENL